MAEWRKLNIATITEEKVDGEEVGQDGTVEMISSSELTEPCGRQSFETRPSLERTSSLVEKEVEEEEQTPTGKSSVLSSITFEDDQPPTARIATSTTTTLPVRTTRSCNQTAAPSFPSLPSMTLPRPSSRASGFTMSLSEKFVTELSFYDPWGKETPLQSTVILLGVFLATDQVLGDHSIYKVSPVSPLAALKIRPQDKLLKINRVSLDGWSHACVVDFVKCLTFSAVGSIFTQSNITRSNNADTLTDVRLSMELRRVGTSVRSPHEAPVSRIFDVTLRIKRKRATVTTVQQREACVRHRATLPRLIGVVRKGFHLSIHLAPTGVAGLVVRAEEEPGGSWEHRTHASHQHSTPANATAVFMKSVSFPLL